MSLYRSAGIAAVVAIDLLMLQSSAISVQRPTLDGFWVTDGYGYLFKIEGARLEAYELTSVSCIKSFSATRKSPHFYGPVVLLTGPSTVSAGETFAMSLMERTPAVIKIGEHTQGVFSDVLERILPNGWNFGLPNERYLTKDGRSFDGPGIPPDIAVAVFPQADLQGGRDGVLEKAVELLNNN